LHLVGVLHCKNFIILYVAESDKSSLRFGHNLIDVVAVPQHCTCPTRVLGCVTLGLVMKTDTHTRNITNI